MLIELLDHLHAHKRMEYMQMIFFQLISYMHHNNGVVVVLYHESSNKV